MQNYYITYGWDVENYLSVGVRYCTIYSKPYQGANDLMTVEYIDESRRQVFGKYLFTNVDNITKWIEEQKYEQISYLNEVIQSLLIEIDKINKSHSSIKIESPP